MLGLMDRPWLWLQLLCWSPEPSFALGGQARAKELLGAWEGLVIG